MRTRGGGPKYQNNFADIIYEGTPGVAQEEENTLLWVVLVRVANDIGGDSHVRVRGRKLGGLRLSPSASDKDLPSYLVLSGIEIQLFLLAMTTSWKIARTVFITNCHN